MFSLISGFWQYLFTTPSVNVLLIGLDYAGKTTLLEKLKGLYRPTENNHGNRPPIPPNKIPPTIGMNLAKLAYQGYRLILWDLGGQVKMRHIWEKYYDDAECIVFIVDSCDRERLEEAKLTYEAICDHEGIRNTPILILANKQDLPNAMSAGELAATFFSIQDSSDHRSRIFPISAVTGTGIERAMQAIFTEAKTTNAHKTSSSHH